MQPEKAERLDDDELLNPVPSPTRRAARRVSLSSPSMVLGVFAFTTSLLTPWVTPAGAVALVLAVIALLRRHDDRVLAWWGLGLALASIVFGGVWALWIMDRLAAGDPFVLPLTS